MKLILIVLLLFTTLNISSETNQLNQIQKDILIYEHFNNQLKCMSENIIFEAGNQSIRGKIAVAQVTLNRVESHKFGSSLCEVIYQPKQYSWTNKKKPKYSIMEYKEAYVIAINVIAHEVSLPELKDALFYHATYTNPCWRHKMTRVAQIEQHIFYKM